MSELIERVSRRLSGRRRGEGGRERVTSVEVATERTRETVRLNELVNVRSFLRFVSFVTIMTDKFTVFRERMSHSKEFMCD